MKEIYIVDWLINKPIKLKLDKHEYKNLNLKNGDKILYSLPEENKEYVGIYITYPSETIKEGNFIKKLDSKELEQFNQNQEKARDLYEIFKKEFKSNFEESVPVYAKMDLSGRIIYFYFYAEVRFQFSEFIKEFRKKIGMNFFLFQVGARDRIRFTPSTDDIYGTCGHKLCCKMGICPLPSVDSDNIMIQNLENRGIEKMKGRCGKLKCCLNFEKTIYNEEGQKFPKKGDSIKYNKNLLTVYGFNIMNGEIIAKNEKTDEILKLHLHDIGPNDIIKNHKNLDQTPENNDKHGD